MGNEDNGFTSQDNAEHIRTLYREIRELQNQIDDLRDDNNNIWAFLREAVLSLLEEA